MDKILDILKKSSPETDFETSSDFIEDGLLDSFDVISLVTDLENEFDIEIDGTMVLPENFCNVDKIKDLVIQNGGTID